MEPQPVLTQYAVPVGAPRRAAQCGSGGATFAFILVAVLVLMALYARYRKSHFIGAGVPRSEWPGPTMTFPRGEVWPYPSYY